MRSRISSGSRRKWLRILVESMYELVEVAARELPLERLGDHLVMPFEESKSVGQHFKGVEIVWREHLALDDGEVDLDLVEPTRMDGTMNHPEVGVAPLQALHTALTTVGGAIVHDPEHASSRPIGFLAHRLVNQPIEWCDAAGGFAPSEDPGTMHIHGSQIGPCAQSLIFVLDLHRVTRLWRDGGMDAAACLDAGFLVSRDHKLVVLERFTLPLSLIEIENPSRLCRKIRVTRKNPTPVLPWTDGVLV